MFGGHPVAILNQDDLKKGIIQTILYGPGAIHPILPIVLVQFILFFKLSWCKKHSKEWNKSVPQAAVTTFAFSSVFTVSFCYDCCLLGWGAVGGFYSTLTQTNLKKRDLSPVERNETKYVWHTCPIYIYILLHLSCRDRFGFFCRHSDLFYGCTAYTLYIILSCILPIWRKLLICLFWSLYFFEMHYFLHNKEPCHNTTCFVWDFVFPFLIRLHLIPNHQFVESDAGLGIRSFQKNIPFFAFFCVLYKRTFRSLRSFAFFIKERSVLFVLFRSL